MPGPVLPLNLPAVVGDGLASPLALLKQLLLPRCSLAAIEASPEICLLLLLEFGHLYVEF